jgi:hypothetical protein|tara:strand:- start:483 stop:1226 length:744 start_codon:yes stop_codon:yes gene_type:complete
MADEQKFPSEIIDLPSEGKLYSKDSPLKDGKIEIKYMTAKEEDILTSQNLIKKGVVVDRLIDSLILTQGVKSADLILGDKNAVMVAARILAYGPEYVCDIPNPQGGTITQTFNLAECPFIKLPDGITKNKFEVDLPISKKKITFKLLTGKEENVIIEELKASKKIGSDVSPELTTRLRHTITSVEGDESQSTINNFVQNLLARDSMYLRKQIKNVTPDIELSQEVEIEGESVKVDIPMTVGFFWPES